MPVWFDGSSDIACTIQLVKAAVDDYGSHHVAVMRLFPGVTHVDLVEQGSDFVTVQTNEGLQKRTSIRKRIEAENVVVEFDEEYQAGSRMTVQTHFVHEFTSCDAGVRHRLVMSNVEATGVLGFFYRTFGKSNIGNGLLKSHKTFFENQVSRY